VVGHVLAAVAQKLGGALDGAERRLELVGDVRREGRDVVGAVIEPVGHVEEALRAHGQLARAVMIGRADGAAAGNPDRPHVRDERLHGARDGAPEQEADNERHPGDGGQRRHDAAVLGIEILDDVVGRAGGVDDAHDLAARHDRHGGEDAHAGAAGHRIERGRGLVAHAQPHHAAVLATERAGDLLDMGEREPKLIAAGNDHAVRVENAQARERDLLGLREDGLKAPPAVDEPRIGRPRGRAAVGSRRQDLAAGEIEAGLDRRVVGRGAVGELIPSSR
jgi:hypothetical protein